MAWRIQEADLSPANLHLIRADALCDAAGLGLHDLCLANSIQERGLAMIHMPQYRHDRRTRLDLTGILCLADNLPQGLRDLRLLLFDFGFFLFSDLEPQFPRQ